MPKARGAQTKPRSKQVQLTDRALPRCIATRNRRRKSSDTGRSPDAQSSALVTSRSRRMALGPKRPNASIATKTKKLSGEASSCFVRRSASRAAAEAEADARLLANTGRTHVGYHTRHRQSTQQASNSPSVGRPSRDRKLTSSTAANSLKSKKALKGTASRGIAVCRRKRPANSRQTRDDSSHLQRPAVTKGKQSRRQTVERGSTIESAVPSREYAGQYRNAECFRLEG